MRKAKKSTDRNGRDTLAFFPRARRARPKKKVEIPLLLLHLLLGTEPATSLVHATVIAKPFVRLFQIGAPVAGVGRVTAITFAQCESLLDFRER